MWYYGEFKQQRELKHEGYRIAEPRGEPEIRANARANDGAVRSVFDACRQCYRFHKGYIVVDGFLVCRLCGNRYRLDQMETGMASCQPIHIENTQHGNKVEVKDKDKKAGDSDKYYARLESETAVVRISAKSLEPILKAIRTIRRKTK